MCVVVPVIVIVIVIVIVVMIVLMLVGMRVAVAALRGPADGRFQTLRSNERYSKPRNERYPCEDVFGRKTCSEE